MKNIQTKNFLNQRLIYILASALSILSFIGIPYFQSIASAAQITSRKVTLSSSGAAATGVSYTFTSAALPTTGTAVKSVSLTACTTASGTCTTPTGFVNSSSTLAAQPSGVGAGSGWTVNTSTAGSLRIVNAANATTPSGTVSIEWDAVTNPTTANTSFYMRMTTYSDSAWTTAVDSGTVAVSTTNQITVTATVDESLTFCTGASGITTSSCGGATGTSASLGTLTSSTTGSATSQLGVGTNGQTGYSITVSGTTLTSGGNTISALASQTAAAVGGEQFGINLRDNATPNIGSDPDGSGTGTATANYNTADQFRFVSGDSIASKSGSEDFRRFTASYIANIGSATEAGTYSTTLTYICTATF
jgi:hypothetical protein